MLQLFINLSIAHLLADFYLQTKKMCESKQEKCWKSKFLYIHAFIAAALSWVSVWDLDFWWMAIVIVLTHLIIDGIKCSVERLWVGPRYCIFTFVADQILHVGVLAMVAYVYSTVYGWRQFSWVTPEISRVVSYIVVALLCWKPSNILLKLILHYCQANVACEDQAENNNFRSGALIGTTERLLVVFFVMIKQYEAIGFLVAAKSILRFNETKGTEKSEYVLAGTFLSLIIAIVWAYLIG